MHSGARGTLEALREYYYWPSMEADVRAYCATCLSCQLENAVFRCVQVLGGHLTAAPPRVAWSLDCAPSIKTAKGSRSSILIAVDDFTQYTLYIEIPRLDSNSVKKAFVERIVGPYGRPQRVRTDQGREFEGGFASFLEHWRIEHIRTRPVLPWTNGRAEWMVLHIKALLRRLLFK